MNFMTSASPASPILTLLGSFLIAGASCNGGESKAVVGMSAFLLSDPPGLKKTGDGAPYGSEVEIIEEKTAGKEKFAAIRLKGQSKTLGWLKVEGNLGHVKEFD